METWVPIELNEVIAFREEQESQKALTDLQLEILFIIHKSEVFIDLPPRPDETIEMDEEINTWLSKACLQRRLVISKWPVRDWALNLLSAFSSRYKWLDSLRRKIGVATRE